MARRFVDGRPLPAPWIKRTELGVETIVCGCEETAPPNHVPRPEQPEAAPTEGLGEGKKS